MTEGVDATSSPPVPPEPHRAWRLYPHEITAAVYVLAGFILLERLPVTYPRSAIVLGSLLPATIIFCIGATVIVLRRRYRGNAVPELPLRAELLLMARSLLVLVPVLSMHFLLKSFIHLMNGRTWDKQLYVLDQAFHLGFSPSRFFTTLFANRILLALVDVVYSNLYFVVVVTYTALLLSIPPLSRRLSFASAYTLIWIAGSVVYLAIPSWGPVFLFSSDFQQTLSWMPLTVKVQRTLFHEIYSLVTHPLAPRLIKFGSVAAFPSMHLAVTGLFAIASRGVSRTWFRANLLLLAIMIIGSVVTGYHYLIDDYAGLLIAAGMWFVSRRYFSRVEPPAVMRD